MHQGAVAFPSAVQAFLIPLCRRSAFGLLLLCVLTGCGARTARLDIPTGDVFFIFHGGVGITGLQINHQDRHAGTIRLPPGRNSVSFRVGFWPFYFLVDLEPGKRYVAQCTQHGMGSTAFLFCDIVDADTGRSVCSHDDTLPPPADPPADQLSLPEPQSLKIP